MDSLTAHGGGLRLLVDWEPGEGVTSPALAATWCRLQVQVEGRYVTAVDDHRTGSMRRGIYTSAYPLAEWVAEHWWLLRRHVRPSAFPRSSWAWSNAPQQPWLRAHNTRGAGGGMPWPDLTIVPEGAVTRLVWNAGPGLSEQPVTFLTSGQTHLSSDDVADALARFVDQVLVRLEDAGVHDTPLQREWQLITGSDDDENAFAAAMARLGRDPFDATDDLAEEVVELADALEPEVLDELLDSAQPEALRTALTWVNRAREMARTVARPGFEVIEFDRPQGATSSEEAPWATGYAAARAYRSFLEVDHDAVFPVSDYVGHTPLSGSAAGIEGVVVVQDVRVGLVLPQGRSGPSSLRFAQARALGLSLLTQRSLLLLDPARTDLGKASRAFAAEILAPAAGIEKLLADLPETTDSAIDAIADRFKVSPRVVQHQHENQLAV